MMEKPNFPHPELSVIICTYNRAELLNKTLVSLLSLQELDRAEIIVVDNRSSDHTAEVVHRFIAAHGEFVNVTYYFEAEQGLSAARNAGIRLAAADIIAFLDDDAIPSPSWIRTIISAFERNPDMSAMGGPIAPIFESERPEWLTGPLELPYTIVNLGTEEREYPRSLNPFGANMAMRREALKGNLFPLHLGRKGNLLLSGEESWVFMQIRGKGGLVKYHPDMAVDHFVPASRLTKEWVMNRYYCQGMSYAVQCTGLKERIVLIGKTAAKLLYIAVSSVNARSAGSKMLIRCRLESIRGTMDTVRNRKSQSAAG
jgi:glycosyltransferase involved in cell wall biosynthesis